MGKLRKTIQRKVLDLIDSSIYTVEDFKVSFGNSENGEELVSIEFLHEPKFRFTVVDESGTYYTRRNPGDFEEEEYTSYAPFQDAINQIPKWCNEIRNELKAHKPIYKEVDQLRKLIEENIASSANTDDEFSVEEINDLRQKFDGLQSRIERLEKDKIITDRQMTEIMSGLNQIREDVEYYPKDTWIKTATNKLVNIVLAIGKSKEGRKVITDGARKLLDME